MAVTSLGLNAVLAKSRAMYGNRLTPRNYTELLACRTVPEVAAYLKSKTHYSHCLDSITPQSVHREQLENLLKRYLYWQYTIIRRYEISIGQDFYSYFVVKSELELILTQLHKMNAQQHTKRSASEFEFIKKLSRLDADKIADAKNLLQLEMALQDTEYGKIIHRFTEKSSFTLQENGTLEIEAALCEYEYSVMKTIASKHLKGKQLEEVLQMLKRRSDLQAIINIYRMKKMLKAPSMYVRRRVVMNYTQLSQQKINQLLDAEDAEDFERKLKTTCYGKELSKVAYDYIEEGIQKIQYNFHLKKFRFSTNPSAVMLCYFFLAENELTNVVHIIEGIRYGMHPDEIDRILVGIQ